MVGLSKLPIIFLSSPTVVVIEFLNVELQLPMFKNFIKKLHLLGLGAEFFDHAYDNYRV